jgi:ribonuclease J
MRVRIHRGTKEIGGTCVELAHAGQRIVLDFGLPLDGAPDDATLVPRILGDDLAGIVISHPHIDHYGLLHHLAGDVPVAMGTAARRITRTAAPFTGQPVPGLEDWCLEHRKPVQIGPFRITPYLVDHSAYDAYSLLVEAGGKRLFYSGDFRAHGRKAKLFEQMVDQPPADIDVLLMEGSSLSRLGDTDRFPSERDLEVQLTDCMSKTQGLVMMHTSAQNIDRVVTLYRACRRSKRTLIIDLYAAAILEATGNMNIPQSGWPGVALYVPQAQRRLVKRNQWFELLQRHAKQRIFEDRLKAVAPTSAMLFRPLMMADLDMADALADARFVYSQWPGYLESGTYDRMTAWLERLNIPIDHIHTSGHASPVDLKRFAAALAPKALVPIHSFAADKYAGLFANVVPRDDGEWWDA